MKYKKGDWIEIEDITRPKEKILFQYDGEQEKLDHPNCNYYKDSWRKWKPKADEVCLFSDGLNITIVRAEKDKNQKDRNLMFGKNLTSEVVCVLSDGDWVNSDCEPYIGKISELIMEIK